MIYKVKTTLFSDKPSSPDPSQSFVKHWIYMLSD